MWAVRIITAAFYQRLDPASLLISDGFVVSESDGHLALDDHLVLVLSPPVSARIAAHVVILLDHKLASLSVQHQVALRRFTHTVLCYIYETSMPGAGSPCPTSIRHGAV